MENENKALYKSRFTDFIAYNEPLVDKIYYKWSNVTAAIILVDNNWKMRGIIKNENLVPSLIHRTELSQSECENCIMSHMPSPNRQDILIRLELKVYDSAEYIYRTRAISAFDLFWLAWSDDDKAEDYLPMRNYKIWKSRFKSGEGFPDQEAIKAKEVELLKDEIQ